MEGKAGHAGARILLPATRRWFAADIVILAAAGVQCFILATATDQWFAWTVSPSLSAAVLGAGYFGTIVMVAESRRAQRWADAEVVLVGTFVFSTLTLLVTFVHRYRFHFHADDAPPRAAAIAWVVVYTAVPPLVLWLVASQRQAPGFDPPVAEPKLSPAMTTALTVEAAAVAALGLTLFIRGHAVEFWPWTLTDLTARAISAWMITVGFMLWLFARVQEVARIRFAAHSILTTAALWIVAMARFRDTVRWRSSGTIAVVLLALLIGTVASALRSRDT
jgi:hypothetical protein